MDSGQRYNAVEVRLAEFIFRCTECGVTYAETEVRSTCPSCTAGQEFGGVVRGVLEVELATLPDGRVKLAARRLTPFRKVGN